MHIPVLLEESLNNLITRIDGIYVDCTTGGGGHLAGLADRLGPEARIYALDKDEDILKQTAGRFSDDSRIRFIHSDFRHLEAVMQSAGIYEADGVLIDLGVSSFQLDEKDRGFSFHEDAILDMRMDRNQPLTAEIIINEWEEGEIARVLYEYGEERYSRRIARNIVAARKVNRIGRTLELVEIIKKSVPAAYKGEKHPARRSFQALRIAVNSELDAVEEVLPQALKLLRPGGRIAVISFHSLEDRIVKQYMKNEADPCKCPKEMPACVCGLKPTLRLISRKGIAARDEELEQNPRARSALLRVAEKLPPE